MTVSMNILLKKNRENILTIAKEHGIESIKVFGSVAKLEDQEDSDIDFLVRFEEGRSLFELIRFKQEMESLFDRNVDVVTENSIHQSIKEKVLHEAILI